MGLPCCLAGGASCKDPIEFCTVAGAKRYPCMLLVPLNMQLELYCVLQHDDIGDKDIQEIVDAFPGQTIDFFGALRARVYDDRVRSFVQDTGMENIGKRLVNSREKVCPPSWSLAFIKSCFTR